MPFLSKIFGEKKQEEKDDIDILLDNLELIAVNDNNRLDWGYRIRGTYFMDKTWITDTKTKFKFEYFPIKGMFFLTVPYKNELTKNQSNRVGKLIKNTVDICEKERVINAYGDIEKISAEFKAKNREYEIRKENSTVNNAYKNYLTLLMLHLNEDETRTLQPVLKDYNLDAVRSTEE